MCRAYSVGGLMALVLALFAALAGGAAESGWIDLTGDKELTAWTPPTDGWVIAGGIALDPQNPRRLAWKPGSGILVNGPKGSARNLVTRQKFTDLEAHVEFLIAKGSNSGVKFMGLYEIQIVDSNGRKELTGDSCGGIYPRAEEKPRYHHIDQGVPPKVNAAKPAGEWQTLDMVFQAPRFDAAGQKIANARFVKVVLNGQVVQENVEVPWPTGAAWRQRQEVPAGPFLLQGDHGPVAFRNVRIRPWSAEAGKGKP